MQKSFSLFLSGVAKPLVTFMKTTTGYERKFPIMVEMKSDRPNHRGRLPGLCACRWKTMFCICSLVVIISGCGTSSNGNTSQNSPQHQVDLSWNSPSSSPVEIVGYNVYRSPKNSSSYQRINSSTATETVYADTMVQSGASYNYFVTSVDGAGVESAPSNTVAVTVP